MYYFSIKTLYTIKLTIILPIILSISIKTLYTIKLTIILPIILSIIHY